VTSRGTHFAAARPEGPAPTIATLRAIIVVIVRSASNDNSAVLFQGGLSLSCYGKSNTHFDVAIPVRSSVFRSLKVPSERACKGRLGQAFQVLACKAPALPVAKHICSPFVSHVDMRAMFPTYLALPDSFVCRATLEAAESGSMNRL
jgi:hypothetical protein